MSTNNYFQILTVILFLTANVNDVKSTNKNQSNYYISSNHFSIGITSFNVSDMNDKIKIEWTTANESNQEVFTIQKSTDVINWIDISEYPGTGNSSTETKYIYFDNEYKEGTFYYRIKITDANGTSNYTLIQNIEIEIKNKSLSIYPNPSSCEITLSGSELELSQIKIYQQDGTDVSKKIIITETKTNNLKLDVSQLTYGIYIIKTDKENSRFIKN